MFGGSGHGRVSPVRVPGEHDSFESFFRSHASRIRGYVRTLVPAAEVEPVVASTFATAWEKFDAMPAGLERAWLFGVARNHARNSVRRDARRAVTQAQFAVLRQRTTSHLHDGQLDPHEVASVVDAMASLSDDDQEVLQLTLWHELQPSEIAQVLQIKPDAARARLARARTRLVAALGAMSDESVQEEVS